jgi:flagellin
MEHAHNNLNNVVENTQQAESLIRDTDMAAEMVKHSNENILAQAGQAMLAQANQTNQGVLSLLQ